MSAHSQCHYVGFATPIESQLYCMTERFQSSGFAMGCRLPGINCVKTFVQFREEQTGPRLIGDLKQIGQAVAILSIHLSICPALFERLEPHSGLKLLLSQHNLQLCILRHTETGARFVTCGVVNHQGSWGSTHTFSCPWCKVERKVWWSGHIQ